LQAALSGKPGERFTILCHLHDNFLLGDCVLDGQKENLYQSVGKFFTVKEQIRTILIFLFFPALYAIGPVPSTIFTL
jgi:hypothetical protein